MITAIALRLFLVGGSADTCYADFLRLAGGADAKIVVLPHASSVPDEAAKNVVDALKALGATNVTVMMPKKTRLGRRRFSIPQGTKALFITGGDQTRLVARLGESGRNAIKRFLWQGGLVAGTSAGAAAAAERMVAGGMADGVIKPGALIMGNGLGLLPGAVVDTHFAQRQRFNRLIAATQEMRDRIGIGLDEDTAVFVQGNECTVYGAGNVRFYAAAGAGTAISILKSGDRFDLARRKTL